MISFPQKLKMKKRRYKKIAAKFNLICSIYKKQIQEGNLRIYYLRIIQSAVGAVPKWDITGSLPFLLIRPLVSVVLEICGESHKGEKI